MTDNLTGILVSRQAPSVPRHSARRASGYVYSTGDGPDIEGETLQCQHCGSHWVINPGSGRQRGWCLSCDGPTCGKGLCETVCTPVERLLERIEHKVMLDRAIEAARG